jgi:prepilin-type N-terminal cleavage/methylation domain-containing protein
MSMNIAPRPRRRAASRSGAGFTLVELLTVIAIIAILAAIIFPVFAQVRENTRRASCMSNMQKIYQAVKQYELDNRRYPDYLFGPALAADGTPLAAAGPAGLTMDQVSTYLRATITSEMRNNDPQQALLIKNVQDAYRNSIFPEYINDLSVYRCPNNSLATTTADTSTQIVERLEKFNDGSYARVPRVFYRYDSYDANPAIGPDGQQIPTTFKARYSRVWYPLLTRPDIDRLSADAQALYRNQLVFSNPSNDTFITMCTYHASNSKIIQLWLNGQAKVLDTKKLNAFPATPASDYGDVQHDFAFFKTTPTKN